MEKTDSGGIGFLGAMTLLFIALKLLEKIDWSWWWVLSPILIPLAIAAILIFILGMVSLIGWFIDRTIKR